MTIDKLATLIYSKKLSLDDALAALKGNEVLVWPEQEQSETWQDVDANAAAESGLAHALGAVGARDRFPEFAAEVIRLRNEGHTISV